MICRIYPVYTVTTLGFLAHFYLLKYVQTKPEIFFFIYVIHEFLYKYVK